MQVVAAFLFVVFVFVILAARSEINHDAIVAGQTRLLANTIAMCEQRRANTMHTNATWDALTAIERHNRFIDNELRRERLAVYEQAKLIVPDCTRIVAP